MNYLADLMRGHLKKIGSRRRLLPAGKNAGWMMGDLERIWVPRP
ncbi:hypothetical protein OG501_03505 [Streptomyces niveus]